MSGSLIINNSLTASAARRKQESRSLRRKWKAQTQRPAARVEYIEMVRQRELLLVQKYTSWYPWLSGNNPVRTSSNIHEGRIADVRPWNLLNRRTETISLTEADRKTTTFVIIVLDNQMLYRTNYSECLRLHIWGINRIWNVKIFTYRLHAHLWHLQHTFGIPITLQFISIDISALTSRS